MIIPPNVVLSFSYIRGLLVYCPFLMVRFTAAQGILCFVKKYRQRRDKSRQTVHDSALDSEKETLYNAI